MTDYSKTTKAQLIRELEGYREQQRKLVAQLDAVPPRPKNVPEASALADCIRALDELAEDASRRRQGFGGIASSASSDIERVLRSLASKYRVTLIEVKTEPCFRTHVDEIDMSHVTDAIRSSQANRRGIDFEGV